MRSVDWLAADMPAPPSRVSSLWNRRTASGTFSVSDQRRDGAETESLGVAWKRARTRDRVRDASGSTGVHVLLLKRSSDLFFCLKPNRPQQRHRINPCAITVWSVREWMGGEVFQVDGQGGKKEGKVEDEIRLKEFIVSFFFFFFLLVRGGSC